MATTICASSNISIYSSTKPTPRTSLNQPSSSQRLESSLVFDNSLTAIALANAAVEAARDAVTFAFALREMSFHGENEVQVGFVSGMRRKKRRRRRKWTLEFSSLETGREDCMDVQFSCRSTSSSKFLTPKEEATFTLYLKEGARLEAARRRICETGQCEPTSSQWAETIGMKRSSLESTLCKARESRERIVLSYRRLVASIANSYQHKGLSLKDLVQEGSIGLLRGAERFDPNKGYKLSTYVYWWIKQAILKAIASKSRIIRLPGGMAEMLPKIAEANTLVNRRLRRHPTIEEVATITRLRIPNIRLLLERSRPPISLDEILTDHGCMRPQDIMAGPDELRPETIVKKELMKREVEKLLTELGEREAVILRLYYGLTGETPCSFEEIGRLLNLSRERVRQIHCLAFTKLRLIHGTDDLRVYLL